MKSDFNVKFFLTGIFNSDSKSSASKNGFSIQETVRDYNESQKIVEVQIHKDGKVFMNIKSCFDKTNPEDWQRWSNEMMYHNLLRDIIDAGIIACYEQQKNYR